MKIKDICILSTKSVVPQKDVEYHLYSLPAFDENQQYECVDGKEIHSNKWLIPDKCILFNKLNVRFRRVWRIDNNAENKLASTEFLPLVVNEKKVDFQYCYYLLISDAITNYLCGQNSNTSGSHKRIDTSDFFNININLPTIEEQKRIGKILHALDKKIALNRQINENLEALARQLYDYWFVQFDFPDANGKPYKSSGGKMVYNPILKREIPEGWEYVTANVITNVVTGKEDANFSTPDGKYPFFTCSRENLLCSKAAFSGKAILIAGNGDFNVKHYNGEFNAYQRTYVLIPEDEKYYGVLYFSATGKIDIFRKGANGSIVKFITKGDVEQIGVFNCKNENLYAFINNLILQIENNNAEILCLTKQRDELLPLLMNGQVTVE